MSVLSFPFTGLPVSQGARYGVPSISGAGRFQDYEWPDPVGSFTSAVSTAARGRNGTTGTLTTTSGGGGGSTIIGFWKGVDCANMLATIAGSFIVQGAENVLPAHVATTKGTLQYPPTCDDLLVYRFIAIMANATGVNPIDDNGHDLGFQCVQGVGTTGLLLGNANLGFGFQLVDANRVRLDIRGAGGLVSQYLTAAPFDVTAFHAYEFRIFSATATTEAQLQVLIDGVPISVPLASSSWGTGTNLPPASAGTGRQGFWPRLANFGGNANGGLLVKKLKLIAAPTLQSCL